MATTYSRLLIVLFIFGTSLLNPLVVRAENIRHVLLLNSYNVDLDWTADITRGVQDTLLPTTNNIKLSVEFMDSKNYLDPDYLELLRQEFNHKYRNVQFDAIITSDDNAVDFAMKYHAEIFNNAPIIFCGVNDAALPERVGFQNMTGVVESLNMEATIEAIVELQPDIRTIFMVVDKTTTSKINRAILETTISKFQERVHFAWIENMSIEELRNTVSNLPRNSAILLVAFNVDKNGRQFTFSESITQLRDVARCPIYGFWDFYLGEGIVGGMLTSGYYQGKIAAEMTLEVLNGTAPQEIPVMKQQTNRYMFDYVMLKKFGLDVNRLPKDSIIINRPESIYSQYGREIIFLIILVVMLVFVIIILLHNIRGKRLAEDTLAEMNDYQERLIESRTEELTQRSRELEMANYELRKVDNLKTAVLNTVSHDLRTPLTSVLGFCKIIDRDFKRYFLPMSRTTTDLEARGARITFNLGIIEKEGERLTRLINDFLDLSKIESGEIAWNDISVDPRELLMQAKPVLEGYFSMSGVSLNINFTGTLPHVTADPDRLLQVFNNLIGNAAKFTSYGQVDVNASTTEGGWLKISISDTGVGIPHDEIAHIFDNFYQVSRNKLSDNVQRGSGMGLAITRRIIEHYGGSIYVCSEQDKGSIFTFTIPSAG